MRSTFEDRRMEESVEQTISKGASWNEDNRGGWTDSRGQWFPNRIQDVLKANDIVATRVNHALFETPELAKSVLHQIKDGANPVLVQKGKGNCRRPFLKRIPTLPPPRARTHDPKPKYISRLKTLPPNLRCTGVCMSGCSSHQAEHQSS